MRGIIYCIKQKGTGFDSPIYIGSTKDFNNRKHSHKQSCNNLNDRQCNLKVYKYIRYNGDWDMFEMIEIGVIDYETRKELIIEEQKWIEDLGSDLNEHRAYLSPEEKKKRYIIHNKKYRQENRQNELKRVSEYYKKNKNKYSNIHNCPCGGTYTIKHKPRHIETKKHQTYVENLNKDLN